MDQTIIPVNPLTQEKHPILLLDWPAPFKMNQKIPKPGKATPQ